MAKNADFDMYFMMKTGEKGEIILRVRLFYEPSQKSFALSFSAASL